MQFKTIITQKLPFFVALGLATVLTSCGSFQYAGYDNDGIYSAEEPVNETQETVVTTSTDDSNYYKNYFSENSAEVDAIKEESEVFTNIDSYESDYTEQATDTIEEQPAYGGWGQNSNTVTINYIDNGWYGYNNPWMFNGGFGYYNWGRPWGFNNRWSLGYNNWGYGGYYGYGYNSPWFYNNGFGYGYGYNNYNGYYRNNNRYAYSNSRRGSLLYNNNLSRRGNSALSRQNYSTRRLSNSTGLSRTRSSNGLRSSNPSTRTIRNSRSTTTTRSNSNNRVTRPTTTRSVRSSSRSTTPTRATRSSGSVRSSSGSTTRSSSSSTRSSSSSTRSSGSTRSSSSSSSSRGSRG